MKRAIRLGVGVLAAGILSAASAQSAAPVNGGATVERIRQNWTPGTAAMIPPDVLTMFPCHDENLPCSKIAPPPVERVTFKGPVKGDPKRGEAIAINIRYGNCIACHALPGHEGGTIGPSLAEYAQRQVPAEYVYQRIWDTRLYNPNAFMPIYGTNKVLTEQEIHDVMAFIGVR